MGGERGRRATLESREVAPAERWAPPGGPLLTTILTQAVAAAIGRISLYCRTHGCPPAKNLKVAPRSAPHGKAPPAPGSHAQLPAVPVAQAAASRVHELRHIQRPRSHRLLEGDLRGHSCVIAHSKGVSAF